MYIGAIWFAVSFIRRAGKLSGPPVFVWFMLLSNLAIPSTPNVMSGIAGWTM